MAMSFWGIRHLAFVLYMLRGLSGLRIHIFREIEKAVSPIYRETHCYCCNRLGHFKAMREPSRIYVSSASVSLSAIFLLVKFP